MRRLATFAAFLLLSIVSFADVVSESTAREAAARFLGSNKANYECKELHVLQKADTAPALYVVNGNGKWAIIAAEDCATPVIMQGDGTFNAEDMPDNMRSLLGTVEYDINKARRAKRPQHAEVRQKWAEVHSHLPRPVGGAEPDGGEVLLKTANWGQSDPYNSDCPTINGKPTYAGCVATAMAIIMRYHYWPESATENIIPSYQYDNKTKTHPEIKDDVTYYYDWISLPLTAAKNDDGTYPTEWDETRRTLLAQIIHRCGAMVKMDYGASASAAITSDAKGAMTTYMGYSNSAIQLYRSNYTNQEWLEMIKSEIGTKESPGHPLLYTGRNLIKEGGHAFVCDGYNQNNNQIHINFGWGGKFNAWFAVCYLGPANGEVEGSVYSSNDSAIFGLVPDKSGSSQLEIGGLRLYDSDKYDTEGLTISSGSIIANSIFNVTVSAIHCSNDAVYSGKMSIALVGSDGAIKKIISSKKLDITLSPGYYHNNSGTNFLTFPCTLSSSDIEFGNRICMCYTVESGGTNINGENWVTTAGTSYNWSPGSNYIVGSIGVVDITTIEIPATVSAGQNLYPGLSLGHKALSSVFWYLDSNSVAGNGYIDGSSLTSGLHTLKAEITYTDGSSEIITRTFQVQ